MKKYFVIVIILITCGGIWFVASNYKKIDSLPVRTYTFDASTEITKPKIKIKEDNIFEFNYSVLSSNIAVGKYTIRDNKVYCKTEDGKFEYIFSIKGETLVFEKKQSSRLPEYAQIDNNAVFK